MASFVQVEGLTCSLECCSFLSRFFLFDEDDDDEDDEEEEEDDDEADESEEVDENDELLEGQGDGAGDVDVDEASEEDEDDLYCFSRAKLFTGCCCCSSTRRSFLLFLSFLAFLSFFFSCLAKFSSGSQSFSSSTVSWSSRFRFPFDADTGDGERDLAFFGDDKLSIFANLCSLLSFFRSFLNCFLLLGFSFVVSSASEIPLFVVIVGVFGLVVSSILALNVSGVIVVANS